MTAEPEILGDAYDPGAPVPVRLRGDLRVTAGKDAKTGVTYYFIKVYGTGHVFQLGEEEYFICQSLDGTQSFESIRQAFEARFHLDLPEKQFAGFLHELNELGLLERAAAAPGAAPRMQTAPEMPMPEAERARPEPPPRGLFHWHLFNPARLLRFLAGAFRPFRHLVWALIPATLLAGLILFHKAGEFGFDLKGLTRSFSIVPVFLLSLFVVNLTAKLVQGTVAHSFGASINRLSLILMFGLVPRFHIDTQPIAELPRRGRLWSHAAPLLARLALFDLGTFVWVSYRATGTLLPDIALVIGQLGLLVFVFTAIPLVPAEGYRWMAEYFEQPRLRERALALLGMRVKGRPAPEALTGREKWGLLFFAVAVIVFTALLAAGVMLYLGVTLEQRFRGTGVVMFLGVFSMALLWLYAARLSIRRLRAKAGMTRTVGRDMVPVPEASQYGAVVPFERHLPGRPASMELDVVRGVPTVGRLPRRSSLKARLFWMTVLGGLGVAAFLPYSYEAGGEFKILPTGRIEVRARVDGEIMEVFVKEGDWVEEGQVLAVLSDWDEVRDLAVTKAELDKARAELRRLEEGPKPEQVQLAQKQVESAEARVTFSKAEAERQAKLLATGHASRRAAEKARSEYDKNLADLAVARANLRLVKSGATKSEIEAARAEVRRLMKEHEYRVDELERTRMRAPAEGRVVTPNPHLLRGQYLPVGGLFVELEDNRTAHAEVEVPETDISEVQVGDVVRLKAWGLSDTILTGRVTSIAPVAETREYGRIVRVKTEIPNPDGTLKSDMTGYAKIEGSEMPAWKAFTRLIIRFFRIEVWSWIP